ncbi:hypothetical protein FB45DRAFT_1026103 [Roridomyces roridus]|uniref:Uncharacterized protein n=1 Tax=Roridomyces roridus TaxID=1738132 RepID=A0AAD7C034_9AGAR|nr:hypothetical protein FB45DRAFT_1026103 [Roridomyces roridus]
MAHSLSVQLNAVEVTALLEDILEQRIFSEPYRVFALACHLDLPDHARAAAKETLHHPVFYRLESFFRSPEFHLINTSTLLSLYAYRAECVSSVRGLLHSLLQLSLGELERTKIIVPWWMGSEHHSAACGPRFADGLTRSGAEDNTMVTPAPWFVNHIKRAARVAEVGPTGGAVAASLCDWQEAFPEVVHCGLCGREGGAGLRELAVFVHKIIDTITVRKDFTKQL